MGVGLDVATTIVGLVPTGASKVIDELERR